jgi:hypothetical protein
MKPQDNSANPRVDRIGDTADDPTDGDPPVQTDQRQGVFLDRSSVQGTVVGTNFGTIISNFYGVEPRARHHRDRMLARVRRYWVEGVLDPALSGFGRFELTLTATPQAVVPPTPYGFDVPVEELQPAEWSSEEIGTAFDRYQQRLLILGPAGSGKTILMLELARRLIAQAEHNPDAPIPVVLNLASWARTRRPLAEWLKDELHEKYDVPPAVSRVWLENCQMALLLDGLDEVMALHRVACVEAINAFCHASGSTPIAVCCRQDAYAKLTNLLVLDGALLLQPLTPQQVSSFFERADDDLRAVGRIVFADPTLFEMARTPLLLGTIVLAYSGAPPIGTQSPDNSAESLQRLFATYVTHMLEPRFDYRIYGVKWHPKPEHSHVTDYTSQDMRRWLTWLAQLLSRRGETIFYIEHFQADALPHQLRGWYVLLVALLAGFLVGPFITLLVSLINPELKVSWQTGISVGVGAALGAGLGSAEPRRAAARYGQQALLWGAMIGLLLGALFGILAGLDKSWQVGLVAALIAGSTAMLVFGLSYRIAAPLGVAPAVGLGVGLSIGLGSAASVGFLDLLYGHEELDEVIARMLTSSLFGITFGLSALFVAGLSGQVRAAETLRWSWRPGLLVGALAGLLFGLRVYLSSEADDYIIWGVREAIIFGLVAGLTGREAELRTAPNEGIRRSALNALWGVPAGLAVWLGLALLAAAWRGSMHDGLSWALPAGLIVTMAWALRSGLFACLQHGLLRLLLESSGVIPHNYVRFLDASTARLLLRRVGGGYIFVHRLLLDYLASEDKPSYGLPSINDPSAGSAPDSRPPQAS